VELPSSATPPTTSGRPEARSPITVGTGSGTVTIELWKQEPAA
jgi:hypothetical protein